ncbi:alpha/beta-hydrolase [Aspergillus violaceofuscus CBS 115571]|uniref:Alpha/beta-hydrolase n=1 Tax=Aspergillus violaceofuscus (strain CBS 115571) TaxID=1450538 RepID=A0A2V5IL74_ASPV1|nr:alpha/beta-hydrolase [Aspergillus violaceofuscus CBS 115571]
MTTTEKSIRAAFPDLEWHKLTPPTDHAAFTYYGFQPSKTVLAKGHVRSPGHRSFPTDVIYDRDVAITLRDGIKIYADIFRPVDSDAVPAVVNVDARGCGDSEGNIAFWGQQEAEDIWDAIDWLARQPWCTGSVGMAGNSWLSIAQVNFAARLSHPALKALAPWEGLTDLYGDLVLRGGRPHNERFHAMILSGFAGRGAAENMPAMGRKRPFYDDYWESKRIRPERIGDVPLYVLASYSSMLHTRGSFETFRAAQSTRKWLRVHPYQEWYDLYRPEMVEDLARYFDRYLKGVENGWEESTPPVRLSLLGFEDSVVQTIRERPEREYPLARQELKRFYLRPETMTLQPEQPVAGSSVAHAGHDLKVSSDFVLYFDQYTEIAGYPQVRLWMSCPDHDDLDVAVQIRKINRDGKLLEHLNYPCPVPAAEVPNVNTVKTLGPSGFLRASHAVTRDEARSTAGEIVYRHDRREPIAPGTIVPLDIGLWPMGMVFGPGEGIMLRVSGHDMCLPEVDFMRPTEPDDENQGTHVVYGGGGYDSYLVLPFV